MQARQNPPLVRHSILAGLAALLLVTGSATAADRQGTTPTVGVFTGEIVDGRPVYRLPAITVQASRKAELARMAAEEKQASARAARRHHVLARSHPPVHIAAQ